MAQARWTRSRGWVAAGAAGLVLGLAVASQGRDPLGVRLGATVMVVMDALLLTVLWWTAAAGWGLMVGRAMLWGAATERGAGVDRAAGGVVGRGMGRGVGGLGYVELAVVGGGVMAMGMWLLGWAGWYGVGAAWGVTGLGWAGLVVHVRGLGREPVTWPVVPTSVVLGSVVLGLMAGVAAYVPGGVWASEFGGYDVLSYHLQLPREWMAAGRIGPTEHNVYGYLPNLMEVVYGQLGLWAGGMVAAVYGAQLLHVTMGVAAAVIVGRIVAGWTNGFVGGVAGAVYLALPWTVVTGTLAYSEQGMMAMGLAGLSWVVRGVGMGNRAGSEGEVGVGMPHRQETVGFEKRGVAVGVGVACGLATMCKLTAGPMWALPVVGWLVVGVGGRLGQRVWMGLMAGVGFSLVVGWWLLRNGMWTGNPVFPMWAEVLGAGHWTGEQVARWSAGVGPGGVMEGLGRVWTEVVWGQQYGYVVWPAAVAGAVAALRRRELRGPAVMLMGMWAVQMVVWLVATHHQGRFALPMVAAGVGLMGLGLGAVWERWMKAAAWGGAAVVVVLTGVSLWVFYEEPAVVVNHVDGVDLMMTPGVGGANVFNSVNALPEGAKVYAEGFALAFFVTTPMTYHTVWDASPIGEALATGRVSEAIGWLRREGYTHVLIDWVMLERWTKPGNYGYDSRVTVEAMAALARALPKAAQFRGQTLHVVPR